jgi:hypothetical protein
MGINNQHWILTPNRKETSMGYWPLLLRPVVGKLLRKIFQNLGNNKDYFGKLSERASAA